MNPLIGYVITALLTATFTLVAYVARRIARQDSAIAALALSMAVSTAEVKPDLAEVKLTISEHSQRLRSLDVTAGILTHRVDALYTR